MIRDNEIINVFDVERVLGDLPIDIIKENIKSQINDPLTYSTNQAEQVYETLEEAINEFGHIDEYRNEIFELKDNFSAFLLTEVNNKFNLEIDIENLDDYEVHNIARHCYEFFIVNLKEVLSNFILNYICLNKSDISREFDDEYKKKDVTTINMKKLTKNKDDVIILSNINSVINYILDIEHHPEDFVELAIEQGEYVGESVKELVNSFKIAGNFVFNIINELKLSHNDTIDEIASNVILFIKNNISEDDLNHDFVYYEE